ncbi:hypothetical protein [Chromobacterium sphagni]|uniref:Uncharacterized protein n=1 Tax=Chromobacterium sphagni TaxID=1903179 RepID=A0A1S1WWN7_9NEIS|nr:hypothetical protein [Chromobacterium sphagni]OHX10176.1 hypothetical protein BI344_22380 [Chromobacterium sphagni]OHX11566.1 hypothetical protein BI347_18095 [Chromobacterium sphagni]
MEYAVQRYAVTRPWAKRVGQLYVQAAQVAEARAQMKDVIRRELERAAQVFEIPQAAIGCELALAEAWGHFFRHGRVVSHLDGGLAQALAHTRQPGNLPDTLALPAEAFFLHVPGEGGAFIAHQPERRALLLTMVRMGFAPDGVNWLQAADQVEVARVEYPGELVPQLAAVGAAWQGLLAAVLNGLAMMTQPRLARVKGWEAGAPADWVAAAGHPSCAKTRQRARSQLLKAGFGEITFCRVEDLEAAAAYQNQGYWRRQSFGEDKAHSRLVWVAPR